MTTTIYIMIISFFAQKNNNKNRIIVLIVSNRPSYNMMIGIANSLTLSNLLGWFGWDTGLLLPLAMLANSIQTLMTLYWWCAIFKMWCSKSAYFAYPVLAPMVWAILWMWTKLSACYVHTYVPVYRVNDWDSQLNPCCHVTRHPNVSDISFSNRNSEKSVTLAYQSHNTHTHTHTHWWYIHFVVIV